MVDAESINLGTNVDLASHVGLNATMYAEYERLVTTIALGPFRWAVAKPCELIKAYLESAALAPHTAVMLMRRGTHPRHPLRLVLYCDEVTPGVALKLNNKRKTNAYYGSFGLRTEEEF